MDSAIPFGSALGAYPERRDSQAGALDRLAQRLTGRIRQYRYSRVFPLRTVAKLVDRQAEGLDALNDAQLQERVGELKYRLRAKGLRQEAVAEAFALVREMAGRVLGMRPFDVQLFGGWVMLEGMLAEMETGEGKTLTATLPACTAALAGIPVHVISVNDYLVRRDAEWMRPLYEALGLSVATVTEGMDPVGRRAAYAADVTYCSNKQIVFDYLRDRLTLGHRGGSLQLQLERLYDGSARVDRLLLRGLHFAIVDEADSVLVDEARTPLVISGIGNAGSQGDLYAQALELTAQLRPEKDYRLQPREREVTFTDEGLERLDAQAKPLGGVWAGSRRREELAKLALSAQHLYVRDRDYLVREGRVQIIDEYTGRVMEDRAWERGLHQMIEAKEGCEVTGQRETLARISYQRFFRRYLRLAGMSGTAQEISGELASVYGLGVVKAPTNKPVRRKSRPDRLYSTEERKWRAIVRRVTAIHKKGRPILVGTRSVAASERLSGLLADSGLAHEVLNARQDQREAEIIGEAGKPGRITVATNMAGRGTDIRLAPGMVERGGLHVIASERHESSRIDRQLFGRCGRQGDPGSYEAILSVDDELLTKYAPSLLRRLLARKRARRIAQWRARLLVAASQRAAERLHARIRRDLLRMDEQLDKLLAFSGEPE